MRCTSRSASRWACIDLCEYQRRPCYFRVDLPREAQYIRCIRRVKSAYLTPAQPVSPGRANAPQSRKACRDFPASRVAMDSIPTRRPAAVAWRIDADARSHVPFSPFYGICLGVSCTKMKLRIVELGRETVGLEKQRRGRRRCRLAGGLGIAYCTRIVVETRAAQARPGSRVNGPPGNGRSR